LETTHRWRAALTTATTTLLLLGTATAGTAQDATPDTTSAIACDGETLDDTDGFLLLAVEPGQTVTCEATGLDPELESQLTIDFFGWTDDDDLELGGDVEFDEPVEVVEETLAPGETTFTFGVPEDLFVGDFQGVLLQGDPADPSYEEFFDGIIFGDFVGGMDCAPDPVEVGAEVGCEVEEFEPGDFDWEVYTLDIQGLLEFFLGAEGLDDEEFDDVELAEPDASGTAAADEDGVGSFAFEAGDGQLYFAVAEQQSAFAFYAGEIVPATAAPAPAPPSAPTGPDPATEPVPEPVAPATSAGGSADDAPVVVTQQPTRVDAGFGGAASGGFPTGLLTALSVTGAAAVLSVRRLRFRA
jgi:hypothetical protein